MYLSARQKISKSIEHPSLGVDKLNHGIKGPERCVPDSDKDHSILLFLRLCFFPMNRVRNFESQTQDKLVNPNFRALKAVHALAMLPEGACTENLLSRKPGFLLSAMHSRSFRCFVPLPYFFLFLGILPL